MQTSLSNLECLPKWSRPRPGLPDRRTDCDVLEIWLVCACCSLLNHSLLQCISRWKCHFVHLFNPRVEHSRPHHGLDLPMKSLSSSFGAVCGAGTSWLLANSDPGFAESSDSWIEYQHLSVNPVNRSFRYRDDNNMMNERDRLRQGLRPHGTPCTQQEVVCWL